MDHPALAHYGELTPDCVLDALQSIGLDGDGRLLALNSYENRVYRVGISDAPAVVVKFYRPGRWSDAQILEEHAFLKELDAAEIPVVAPRALPSTYPGDTSVTTVATHAGFRFSVFDNRGGRAPELEHKEVLLWIGRFIGRIHAIGSTHPFVTRPTIDVASFGEEPRDYLLAHDFIPADLQAAYKAAVGMALDGVRQCFERAGDFNALRLHGDCHAGNILWTDDGPHFVDFDDSRMGPAVQDLWMLVAGERTEMSRQFESILQGYEQFRDFDRRELHLIEALRTLRLIHYAAWIARRWDDPAFPAAFPWFNTQRYWQDRVLELREQIALMNEPPLQIE